VDHLEWIREDTSSEVLFANENGVFEGLEAGRKYLLFVENVSPKISASMRTEKKKKSKDKESSDESYSSKCFYV